MLKKGDKVIIHPAHYNHFGVWSFDVGVFSGEYRLGSLMVEFEWGPQYGKEHQFIKVES